MALSVRGESGLWLFGNSGNIKILVTLRDGLNVFCKMRRMRAFWESEAECYGWDLKHLPQVSYVWKVIGLWGTVHISGLKHWWVHLWTCHQEVKPGCKRCVTGSVFLQDIDRYPCPGFSLYFLSAKKLAPFLHYTFPTCCFCHGLNPSKSESQTNFFIFKLLMPDIVFSNTKMSKKKKELGKVF